MAPGEEQGASASQPGGFRFPWTFDKREAGGEAVEVEAVPVTVIRVPAQTTVVTPPAVRPAVGGAPRRRWGKLTTQYDSDTNVFQNKLSTRLWHDRIKLKASWDFLPEERRFEGPTLGVFTKVFSAQLNVPEEAPFLTFTQPLGRNLKLRYEHDVKEHEGALVAQAESQSKGLRGNGVFAVNEKTLITGSVACPLGQLSYQHFDDAVPAGVTAALKLPLLRGTLLAEGHSALRTLDLTYRYKDDDVTVIPSVLLPTLQSSCVFKRRFNNGHKVSFRYFPGTTEFDTQYKYSRRSLLYKAGYTSSQGVFWAGLWAGKKDDPVTKEKRRLKWQLMLQVDQKNPENASLLFGFKKRFDIGWF
ncbi:putative chloroplast outer envelope protein 37 [Klebsormidium nitens]|uniref:Putative chloroplast outer envelope protein 37 n=1 Tax=Klebsormidium nitens TaxID=105231 RepID=A0A1Y1I8B4_KLENI|nr:putative chloroplast outer envelope protein 37 [Klebsormidium nitens]|eukprot:GAQ87225.1 putative chloroplast outer envelope protein 37 [Klebsormidium nitens]